jgi:hypothetical protein
MREKLPGSASRWPHYPREYLYYAFMTFSRRLVHSQVIGNRGESRMSHQTHWRGRTERRAAALSAAAAFWACLLQAGAQPLKSLDRPQFRADASLILLPVTVTDGRGSIIKGLDAASFTALDNRQPQPSPPSIPKTRRLRSALSWT